MTAVDLRQLDQELTAAGVPHNSVTAPDGTLESVQTYDAFGSIIDLPPEADPVVAAHDATKKDRASAFETAEDTERLRIVNERASEDPAFAALADLTLGKERY